MTAISIISTVASYTSPALSNHLVAPLKLMIKRSREELINLAIVNLRPTDTLSLVILGCLSLTVSLLITCLREALTT